MCALNATTDSLFYVFYDIANVSRVHLVNDKVDLYVFRFKKSCSVIISICTGALGATGATLQVSLS